MNDEPTTVISLIIAFLGLAMIFTRVKLARRAASLYRRLGIDVPEELYAKQFVFIGVLLIIFGFLVATDLWRLI